MPDALAELQAVLGDRYDVEEVIGRGGMAVVYRATDRRLARTVAIKVLSPDLSPLLGEERFEREIRVAARLQHPAIVPLYEAGGKGHVLYYTMPFVEGETLRARLDREGPLPIMDALRIALEVAEALSYAHQLDVIHRDIKPENIMLAGNRVQVFDFGIAHAISIAGSDRLTVAGMALGTPHYVSPEQATSNATIDGRADVYSLGCVLYEMLSGSPPFEGKSAPAILSRHLADTPPGIRVVRQGVSPAIEEMVQESLTKLPADRPNADQFRAAIRELIANPNTALRKRPRPRSIALLVLAAVALAAGWFYLSPRGPAPDSNSVVVFPLSVPGQSTSGVGDLVALLVGSSLEHTEPLRWISGRTELDPQSATDRTSVISTREARNVSRRLGARWYMSGEILRYGDSLTVTLRLHDTVGDSVYQQSESGQLGGDETQSATRLAKNALAPLLGTLIGSHNNVELTYLKGRSLAATAMWLQGEQAKRSANFTEALGMYRRALDIDSTLAVAAVAAAGVSLWNFEEFAAADSLAQLALRHSAGQPARNIAYMKGMMAFVAQEADSSVAFFRSSIAADSLWPESWMMLAETYHHLLPSGTNGDSLAEASFRKVEELDPDFGPVLFHLAEWRLHDGDIDEGESLLKRLRKTTQDSSFSLQLEMVVDCQRKGPNAVDWNSMVRRLPMRVLGAMTDLGTGARYPECAEAAADALLAVPADSIDLGVRWAAFKWLHHWAVARGDMAAAEALIDSGVTTVHPAAQGLYVLDAAEAGGDSVPAVAVMVSLESTLSDPNPDWLWFHGIWSVNEGNTARLDTVLVRFKKWQSSGSRWAKPLLAAFTARKLLAMADTNAAVEQLRSIQVTPGDAQWGLWQSFSAEKVLLAKLLLAMDHPQEAFDIAAEMDGPQSVMYLYFLPESLVIRLRAAKQLGQGATAELLTERLRRLGRTDLLDLVTQ